MFHQMRKSSFQVAGWVVLMTILFGCAADSTMDQLHDRAQHTAPPQAIDRAIDHDLRLVGRMVRAYTGLDGEIIAAIDVLGNDSGVEKEMPSDISPYAWMAIEKIGRPFLARRYISDNAKVVLRTPYGGAYSDSNSAPLPASFNMIGSLLRFSETVSKEREGRADALVRSGGSAIDVQGTADDRRSLTSLRVWMGLERPDGVSMPGCSASVTVKVRKDEQNLTFSLYVDGSGIGIGSKAIVTDDLGSALHDATAACVMKLVGRFMMVPYYRCSTIFGVDTELENEFQTHLGRLPSAELDDYLKRYLFAAGQPMDMSGPAFTASDSGLAEGEAARRGLDLSRPGGKVELVMALWRTMDFQVAADRMDQHLAVLARTRSNAAPAGDVQKVAATSAAERATSIEDPREFGWAENTAMIALDLRRVVDPSRRDALLTRIAQCRGYEEIRAGPVAGVYGARVSAPPADLQRVLRQSGTLGEIRCVWMGWQRMVLGP